MSPQMQETDAQLNDQPDFRKLVAEGLLYTHSRLNANTSKTREATSFLYALIELLDEKEICNIGSRFPALK